MVHGAQADKLIVSTCTDGEACDTSGLSFFVIDRDAAGVAIKDCHTIDSLHATDIRFDDASAALLGETGEAWETIDAVADFGCVLLCTETVDLIDALNVATPEYTKTRQQFGVSIACFQTSQRRMVDVFVHSG